MTKSEFKKRLSRAFKKGGTIIDEFPTDEYWELQEALYKIVDNNEPFILEYQDNNLTPEIVLLAEQAFDIYNSPLMKALREENESV